MIAKGVEEDGERDEREVLEAGVCDRGLREWSAGAQ